MKLGQMMVDPERATSGAWCRYQGDAEFLIGRANGPKAMEAMVSHMRPHVADGVRDLAELPEREQQRIRLEVVCDGVLLGWRGIEDDDGAPIEFSRQKAREILSKPEAIALLEWIELQSVTIDNFRAVASEKLAGKSGPASSGSAKAARNRPSRPGGSKGSKGAG